MTTTADPSTTDPSAAAAAAEPSTEPELSTEDAMLAALDEGIAAESDPIDPEPKPDPESKPADKPDPVPGTPEAAAAAAAAANPGDPAKTEPKAPEPDKETEDEIKTLGLKEKSAERFRALAGEVKALAPVKDALEKAGIKDVAEIPKLVQHSKDYADLIGMVTETGATPDQYGASLEYLRDTNAAAKGDLAAAERAYAKVMEEAAVWAKMLGKELPGVVDPLADHADLVKEVEDGDLTRARALEIAQQRNAGKLHQTRTQQQTEEARHAQAVTQGRQALNDLGNQLAGSDPDYARKQPFLVAALRSIMQFTPPDKWESAARQAYAEIPAMPAPAAASTPAAPTKPVPGPVRSGGLRPALTPTTDDPMEALEMGIKAANGG